MLCWLFVGLTRTNCELIQTIQLCWTTIGSNPVFSVHVFGEDFLCNGCKLFDLGVAVMNFSRCHESLAFLASLWFEAGKNKRGPHLRSRLPCLKWHPKYFKMVTLNFKGLRYKWSNSSISNKPHFSDFLELLFSQEGCKRLSSVRLYLQNGTLGLPQRKSRLQHL